MDTPITTLVHVRRHFVKALYAAMVLITMPVLDSPAFGVVVQTYNRKLEGVRVDFGSGGHAFGTPTGNGTITFDYAISNGQLLVTARVVGTLYWDSLNSAGCGRLTIRYRDFNQTNIGIDEVDLCGPGA